MTRRRNPIEATDEARPATAVIDPPHTNGKAKSLPMPIESLRAIVDALHAAKNDPDQDAVSDRLRAWFAREVSSDGILTQSPSKTFDALLLLSRVREEETRQGWKKSFESIYKRVLRAACQWGIDEGGLSSSPITRPDARRLLTHWKKQPTDSRWERLLAYRLMGKDVPAKVAAACKLGIESDDVGIAVLRSDWSKNASILSLNFSKPSISIEMRIRDQWLFQGTWQTRIRVDGAEVKPIAPPENVCWNSDDDGQYCELRQEFEDGVVLERQLFLSRRIGLALVSDSIQRPSPARLRLDVTLPSSNSFKPTSAHATRAMDVPLETPTRIIPLALPTHRWERAEGDFVYSEEAEYQLSFERVGRAFCCPLVILWDDVPSTEAPRVWRPLTITNDRRVVPPDEAVAYRFVADQKQLVFFRSLVGRRRFAFVGHQTFLESLLGKVTAKGKVKEWLIVDLDDEEE